MYVITIWCRMFKCYTQSITYSK